MLQGKNTPVTTEKLKKVVQKTFLRIVACNQEVWRITNHCCSTTNVRKYTDSNKKANRIHSWGKISKIFVYHMTNIMYLMEVKNIHFNR